MAGVQFSGAVVDGLVYESWLGLAAPKGLPADLAAQLTSAIRDAVGSAEFAGRMSPLGATAKESTPAEFRARVEGDIARFKGIVAARSITPE
jgi:tripartite-type tricarboxylate transporter receptor subunit TctC